MRRIIISILIFICQHTSAQLTKAIRIIDGDTFVIESGDKVRLIGINAPEITDIMGIEAKQHLIELITGKYLFLKADHLSNERDRYSRLLKYVLIDSIDINEMMLKDGYAVAYLKYKFDKPEEYKKAQIYAETMSLGMWAKPGLISKQQNYNHNYMLSLKNHVFHFNRKIIIVVGFVILLIGFGLFYQYKT